MSAISNAYLLYALNIPGGLLDQISDQNVEHAITEIHRNPDGIVTPAFNASLSARPLVSMTTGKINTAMVTLGMNGYAYATTVEMFFQKATPQGERETGNAHVKGTTTKGMILPRTLNVTQDDDSGAQLAMDVIPLSNDGFVDPLVWSDDAALSGTPSDDENWTVGDAQVNGVAIQGIQSITIDYGITEAILAGNGHPFATMVYVQSMRPKFTINTLDVRALVEYGTTGIAIDTGVPITDVSIRRTEAHGVPGATKTTFVVDAGTVRAMNGVATVDGEATADIEITPVDGGTQAPVVITGLP